MTSPLRVTPPHRLALALVLAASSACTSTPATPTPAELLAKSCAGARLDVCEPYAYAIATSGSITPDMLRIGDLAADARIQATLHTCGAASPAAHSIRVEALATGTVPDGGTSTRSFFLFAAEDTDRDGVIDVTVPSPFDSSLPSSTPVTLRFTPRINVPVMLPDGTISTRSCNGASFTTPYTTGEPYMITRDAGL